VGKKGRKKRNLLIRICALSKEGKEVIGWFEPCS